MKRGLAAIAFLATCATTAAAVAGETASGAPPVDDFAPGLLLGVLLMLAVVLVLIGIGIVIGVACVACAGAMIALGVLSSSAAVAILRGRLSAGCRALHYQAFAVLGVPSGIGVLWIGSAMFDVNLGYRYLLVLGSAVGLLAGLAVASVLEACGRFAYRRLVFGGGRWPAAKRDRGGLLEL